MTDGTHESRATRLCSFMKWIEPATPGFLGRLLALICRKRRPVVWHHYARHGAVVSIRSGRK